MRSKLLLLTGLAACTKAPAPVAPPSPTELALGHGLGFADSALRLIKTTSGAELVPLREVDSVGDPGATRGIAFAIGSGARSHAMATLRKAMGEQVTVFRTYDGFDRSPDSIGVVMTTDAAEIVRIRATSGDNYDINNDSVVVLVDRWSRQLGFRLQGAGADWVEGSLPAGHVDFDSLAVALNTICPDVVTQGTGSVEDLARELQNSHTLYCWWD
ncbi:MAG TPA: DUF4253 domain-containing protein [Gemmatimonadales bacterium]|nr:DUF4253 domain-containing protein [Gemmatimonadales bacterium]